MKKRVADVLDLKHFDLWGLAPISTSDGFRYYVTFVDNYSRISWIYLLHVKYEFYDILVRFSRAINFNIISRFFRVMGWG